MPAKVEANVVAGEVTTVDVPLERLHGHVGEGWYSGSTHVHMNYAGNLHNTLENLMMMSAAEDQDIVNEQVANKDNRILDYHHFVPGGGRIRSRRATASWSSGRNTGRRFTVTCSCSS